MVPTPQIARAANLRRMQVWVAHVRGVAARRADPQAFLMAHHDNLGRMMSALCGPADEAGAWALRGLTALDLGEAQIALLAPLPPAPLEEPVHARA